MSDLLFLEHIPVIDGSLKGWLKELKRMEKIDYKYVVPGHGSIGMSSAFDDMKEYIRTLVSLVQSIVSNEGSKEEAEAIAVPEKYLGLQMRGFFYKRNLSCLYNILSS